MATLARRRRTLKSRERSQIGDSEFRVRNVANDRRGRTEPLKKLARWMTCPIFDTGVLGLERSKGRDQIATALKNAGRDPGVSCSRSFRRHPRSQPAHTTRIVGESNPPSASFVRRITSTTEVSRPVRHQRCANAFCAWHQSRRFLYRRGGARTRCEACRFPKKRRLRVINWMWTEMGANFMSS